MNIFDNFGFQMVVATPLKSVMTLEPFIGGACFVEISGRHDSGVLLIEYDDEGKRLKLPERARVGGEAAVAPAAAVTAAPDVVEVPETAADAVIAEPHAGQADAATATLDAPVPASRPKKAAAKAPAKKAASKVASKAAPKAAAKKPAKPKR